MTTLDLPRLSAHSLRDLSECKRRFALRYRVNRYWPGPQARDLDLETRRTIRTGQVFHLIVQQHSMGLDVRCVLEAEAENLPKLATLWRMFEASTHARVRDPFWTEAPLHFTFEGIPFLVRFDRLYREGDAWEILDWKTGKEGRAQLERSWQTRLYRFALAEAGQALNAGTPIRPDAIRMTYWDVTRSRPESFDYDGAAFEADRKEFASLAKEAKRPFDEHLPDDPNFPRTSKVQACERCGFNSYCNPALVPSPARTPPTQLKLPVFTLESEGP